MRSRTGSDRRHELLSSRPWLQSFSEAMLIRELRLALRRLSREPWFVVGTELTFGGGLGATAVILSTIYALLLRPPSDLREPQLLTRLLISKQDPTLGQTISSKSSFPAFRDVSSADAVFAGVAGYASSRDEIGAGSNAYRGSVVYVTSGYFALLGVQPRLGHVTGFSRADRDRAAPAAVVSEGFWRSFLAADPGAIGRILRVAGRQYTIAAVTPEDFTGVEQTPVDVWLPLAGASRPAYADSTWETNRGSLWLSLVARLRPGVSRGLAESAATRVVRQASSVIAARDTNATVVAASVILGRGPDRPGQVNVAFWLGGVSVLLALLACASVTSLLWLRAVRQRQDYATRIAIGASTGALIRHSVSEIVVLAALGAGIAFAIISFGTPVVEHLLLPGIVWPRLESAPLAAAAVFGVFFLLSGSVTFVVLRSGQRDSILTTRGGRMTTRSTTRISTTLIGFQAAVCTVLVFGAMLFGRSLHRVMSLDLGADLDHTLSLSYDLSQLALGRAQVADLYDRLLTRVQLVPGIDHAAIAQANPYKFGKAVGPYTDYKSFDELWSNREPPYQVAVGSGFFAAVGADSLRGRDIASTDRLGGPRVAIVDAPLARLLWGNQSAIGQCMRVDVGQCITVVGVLSGVWKFSILQREKLAMYVPLEQDTTAAPGELLVHTSGDVHRITRAASDIASAVAPDVPVHTQLLREEAEPEYHPWQLGATMFSAFGLLAVLIACVGMYSLVAYYAAKRRHEIGVRLALGAHRHMIYLLVARSILYSVLGGAAVGAFVALAASHWTAGLFFETSPYDPILLVTTVATLLVVSLLATTIPVARDLRPAVASLLSVT